MRKILDTVKTILLLGALFIVGWSATSDAETAQAATCKGSGHSCHGQLEDGTIIHAREVQDY